MEAETLFRPTGRVFAKDSGEVSCGSGFELASKLRGGLGRILTTLNQGITLEGQVFPGTNSTQTETSLCVGHKLHRMRAMTSEPYERGRCRFHIRTVEGDSAIEMELIEDTVPRLANVKLRFEVRNGISLEQARNVAELMNDCIRDVIVTKE